MRTATHTSGRKVFSKNPYKGNPKIRAAARHPFLIITVLHGPNYAYGLVGFIATLGSISSVAVSGNWERRFTVERNRMLEQILMELDR